ncbi:MAG TPA: FecR domain-containing protein [Puia sp.]|jgi:transmembrane sensor|nr:FecR domain-containing protein [Puia sp.]
MTYQRQLILRVLEKHARHERLSKEEMRLLEEYRRRSGEHRRTVDLLGDEQWVNEQLRIMAQPSPRAEMWAAIRNEIDFSEAPVKKAARKKHMVIAASFAVGLVIAGGIYYYYYPKKAPVALASVAPKPLRPGANEVLVGNGREVVNPDTVGLRQTIRNFGGHFGAVAVVKADSNRLTYYNAGGAGAGMGDYHYLAVGSQRAAFSLGLPDGSNVLLRAGATLRYPMQRGVGDTLEPSGEIFFEVAKMPGKPMILRMPDGTVAEVLGTSFHLTAERGGATRLALFNGSVNVRTGKEAVLLKPGDEVLVEGGHARVGPMRDSAALMAWTEGVGRFEFGKGVAFAEAVQKLADYYGCVVINAQNLVGTPVAGAMQMIGSVDELLVKLNLLETGFVTLRHEGREIIVGPYVPGRRK